MAETGSPRQDERKVSVHPLGRVLVVDDSELLLEVVAGGLEDHGCAVRCAHSGAEALELFGQWPADAVVADLHMPEMDGIALIGHLRRLDPAIPVVVLSGDDDTTAVLDAVHEGAFDYVLKAGEDIRPLLATVDRAIDHGRLAKENRRLTEELRARVDELAETNAALVEASRQKNQFVANVSHELRTPLNAIIGFSRIVLRKTAGQLDAQQAKNLRIIQDSAHQLLALVNDLLDFQRLEAGKLNVSFSDVDCLALVEGIVASLQPLAAARNLRLDAALDGPKVVLRTDPDRLRQVLVNLVNNALKYSDKGHVHVDCRIVPASSQVRLSVRDEGIGLTADDLQRIFVPFSQVDGGSTRERDGFGLGLAIVDKLLKLLGGRIEVESEPGKGSTFTVVFPSGMLAHAGPAGRTSPLVLIVDDEIHVQDAVGERLQEAGYGVCVAGSGPEGLAQARRLLPDAVVLDVLMPGMDGWQVLAALRADPATAGIPAVVLGSADEAPVGQERAPVDVTRKDQATGYAAVIEAVKRAVVEREGR